MLRSILVIWYPYLGVRQTNSSKITSFPIIVPPPNHVLSLSITTLHNDLLIETVETLVNVHYKKFHSSLLTTLIHCSIVNTLP